jgi:hypothetical protein
MRGVIAHSPSDFLAPDYETKPGEIRTLASRVYDTREPTDAQLRAVRRAVRQLRAEEADEYLPRAEESRTLKQSYAACSTPSAKEAVDDVRVQLSLILHGRYQLGDRDRNKLRRTLQDALIKLG